jgi:signal transduction histidine kinase
MSTSAWDGPVSKADEGYPLALFKNLLKQMMLQFAAQGACLALYDEHVGQMRVQLHVRLRNTPSRNLNLSSDGIRPRRRLTVHLENDHSVSPSSANGRARPTHPSTEDLDDVSPQQSSQFAVGSTYPIGHELIGFIWQKNEAYVIRHEDYLKSFYQDKDEKFPESVDVVPEGYLVVPIQEVELSDEPSQLHRSNVLGVVVLYQLSPSIGIEFHPRQRAEALFFVERFALYLQNYALRHTQRRTSDYLQYLQDVSMVFPTSVKLVDLVDNMYQFISRIVDVSALLLTLYDRDIERIYDVFALSDGMRMDDLSEQVGHLDTERPIWWRATQQDQRTLQFSPAQEPHKMSFYNELLTGVWGDQRQAESFLFLPMKMYNRVIGSLSLASKLPNAYHPEEVQVLETMVQIVTVGIENVKLYERDRTLLQEAKQREAQLASINSTLQSIGSELNVNQLLDNFVKSVTSLVRVEISVFFQPSLNKEELVAQAWYAPPSIVPDYDEDGLPPTLLSPTSKNTEDELVTMIRLPFQHTILEQLVKESGFFYLDGATLDELSSMCDEGGALFLREINVQQMLMIPMSYQGDFVGMLAVSMPPDSRAFRPKDIGMLLAICAQTTSAIRNAQLFAQREEAYAELQRMDKLKDEFLVTASHELRTPLSAITGYSTLLKRQNTRTSPQHILRYANKISSAAQQLTDLVSKMTEAAKIGAIDKRLLLEPVPVFAASEMAENLLTFNNEQTLVRDVDRSLWVHADALRFRQVLTNLLENAAKYSPAESTITLSARATTFAEIHDLLPPDQQDPVLLVEQASLPLVLIRVQDQGEGIMPEDQGRIFEKFVRAPRSLTTPVRGSGLGLYICRRYVEAMGGRLWLEQSLVNEGSIFVFYLPRVEPPIEAGEQVAGEHAI